MGAGIKEFTLNREEEHKRENDDSRQIDWLIMNLLAIERYLFYLKVSLLWKPYLGLHFCPHNFTSI